MKSTKRAVVPVAGSFLAGLIVGTWVSVLIVGESAYGLGSWSQLRGSLMLSPFLMTRYLPLSPYFPIQFVGALICVVSIFLGIKERYPYPQCLRYSRVLSYGA